MCSTYWECILATLDLQVETVLGLLQQSEQVCIYAAPRTCTVVGTAVFAENAVSRSNAFCDIWQVYSH